MQVEKTSLEGVVLITPRKFEDSRGWFSETYNQRAIEAAGITTRFVQDNQSFSRNAGTIRGLHFQAPPFAQAKLVRVLAGAIIDVIVDARVGSSSFGDYERFNLTANQANQLFVPEGFLHGFITTEPNTMVAYKVNNFYDGRADGAVLWSDPDLGIDWGISPEQASVSDKDGQATTWKMFASPFVPNITWNNQSPT